MTKTQILKKIDTLVSWEKEYGINADNEIAELVYDYIELDKKEQLIIEQHYSKYTYGV